MALTVPAVFSTAVASNVLQRHFVLRFVANSASRMYGSTEMIVADGVTSYFVENRLINTYEIGSSERIDPFLCTFDDTSFRAVISNTIDPGTLTRPSDDWSTFWDYIMSGYVELYASAGVPNAGLSDMLLLFKGRVADVPTFDESIMTFEVESYARKVHQPLPVTKVSDLSPKVSTDKDKGVPFAYGTFGSSSGHLYGVTGAEFGERMNRVRCAKVQTSRWACNRATIGYSSSNHQFWIKRPGGLFIRLRAAFTSSQIGGVEQAEPIGGSSEINVLGSLYRKFKRVEDTGTNSNDEQTIPGDTGSPIELKFVDAIGLDNTEEAQAVTDGANDTFATVRGGDHYFILSGGGHDVGDKGICSFASETVSGDDYSTVTAVSLNRLAWRALLRSMSGYTVNYSTAGPSGRYYATEINAVAYRDYSSNIFDGTLRSLNLGASGSGVAYNAIFTVFVSKESATDVAAVVEMLDIYGIFCEDQLSFDLSPEDELYFSGQGALISSVIGARGGNPLSTSDVNAFPPFITEDILRGDLGAVTAEIDEAAFDALYDSTMKITIAVDDDDAPDSLAVLKEIGENSTTMYYMNAIGQHTLLARKPTVPGSVDATIHRSEIVGTIQIGTSKLEYLVNDINVKYDWMRENSKYLKTTTLSDATSITKNSLRSKRDLSLRLTDKAVVDDSGSTFVTMLKWLFHNPHPIIRVQLQGWERVHLEIGDWFSLDSVSVDPLLKFRGATWAGAKFYIIGIIKTFDGVELEGIHVT